MDTQQIVQSLGYILWLLLAALALGSFALTWLLRQTTDASPGFLRFSAFLGVFCGLAWLVVEWGLPEATELSIESAAELDEARRLAIALFAVLAVLAGTRLGRGGRAVWLGLGAMAAGVAAIAIGAYGWTGGAPLAVSLLVHFLALTVVTGGSMAALVLAHWYLVTPRTSERPLVLSTRILFWALVVQLLLFAVWLAAGSPDLEPFEALTGPNAVFVWLRPLVGILFPMLLVWMAWRTALTRSMESATGLLYVEFAVVLAATIVAAGLVVAEGLLV